jgi:hypothetical protein
MFRADVTMRQVVLHARKAKVLYGAMVIAFGT